MGRRIGISLLASLLVVACTPGVTTAPTGTANKKTKTEYPAPGPSPSVSASVAPLAAFTGQVFGLDGKPAANIAVKGYLISNNGGGIISEQGAGIISEQGAGLISNGSNNFRVLQTGGTSAVPEAFTGETKTDSEGRFTLSHPEGKPLNIEAVAAPTVKAIQLSVASGAKDVKLQLAKTGSVSGKVSAPEAPNVTNFEGVDVFIPGTSYSAKTAADGSFTLANVPVGSFTVIATKTGLGRAQANGVKVESEKTSQVPTLALSVAVPTITSLDAGNGGAGASITLIGTDFGATAGKTFSVTLGGVAVSGPERPNDTTITIKVPANAASGDVIVTVDGVPSNAMPFRVIKKLYLPTRVRHLMRGRTVVPEAIAEDAKGELIPSPRVDWAAEDAAVAVDSGKLVAKSVGQSTLRVSSGTVTNTAVVRVYDAERILVPMAGGEDGYADGLAELAQFRNPAGMVVAPDGTIYVADTGNACIRRIRPDGRVATIAGTGTAGYADGPGADAQFNRPAALAFEPKGGLLVADRNNHRIRHIDLKDPGFKVTTYAGNGTRAVTNGPKATASFDFPKGLEVAPSGEVFVVQSDIAVIRKIGLDGTVSNFAGTSPGAADGGPTVAQFSQHIADLVFDASGTMYVADRGNSRIRKVAPDGTVTTLAGSTRGQQDGVGTAAKLEVVTALAYDGQGKLYLGETLPSGAGNLRTLNVSTGEVTQWTVDGDGPGTPESLGFDGLGELFLLDLTSSTSRVRMIRFSE